MNGNISKYQEALDYINGEAIQEITNSYFRKHKTLDGISFEEFDKNLTKIQELVDKATPKKPLNIYYGLSEQQGICPNCNKKNIEKIMELAYCEENNLEYFKQVKLSNCNRCGQALSWEEE